VSRDSTTYLRLDPAALVAIDAFDPQLAEGVARHAFVAASGHGTTADEALDALVVRLRQLADLIEGRPREEKQS
jgi:hypothetical protein